MRKLFVQVGTLALSIGVLGLVVVQAGLAGCGSSGASLPEPTTPEPAASAASPPTGAPAASAAPLPTFDNRYLPASKAGPVYVPQNPPAQQKSSPKGAP